MPLVIVIVADPVPLPEHTPVVVIATASVELAVATTPKLFAEVLKRFRAMAPFIEFLNAPLQRKDAEKNFLSLPPEPR